MIEVEIKALIRVLIRVLIKVLKKVRSSKMSSLSQWSLLWNNKKSMKMFFKVTEYLNRLNLKKVIILIFQVYKNLQDLIELLVPLLKVSEVL